MNAMKIFKIGRETSRLLGSMRIWLTILAVFAVPETVLAAAVQSKPSPTVGGSEMSARAYLSSHDTLPTLNMTVSVGQFSWICVTCALPIRDGDFNFKVNVKVDGSALLALDPNAVVTSQDGYIKVSLATDVGNRQVRLSYSVTDGTLPSFTSLPSLTRLGYLDLDIRGRQEVKAPSRVYFSDETKEDESLIGLKFAANAGNLAKGYSVISVSGPTHGVLVPRGSDYDYTPNANFFGQDSFTIHLNDSQNQLFEFNYAINVVAFNDVPVATDAIIEGAAGTQIQVDLSYYASDLDTGDVLTYTFAPGADTTNLSWQGSKLSFQAPNNSRAIRTVTYVVTDKTGATATAPVTFKPNFVTTLANPALVVNTDTEIEGVIQIDLAPNVANTPSSDFLISIKTAPTYGTAEVAGTKVNYRRNASFAGSDEFTYEIAVADAAPLVGTVRINRSASVVPTVTGSSTVTLSRLAGGEAQSLKLGSEARAEIQIVDSSNRGVAEWSVLWTIDRGGLAEPDAEGGADAFRISTAADVTDGQGKSKATVNVGRVPGHYVLKATVTEPSTANGAPVTHTLNFAYSIGLAVALQAGTHEYNLGQVIDVICPKLNELVAPTLDQAALRDRCNELIASDNNFEVNKALRAMAPEEVVEQGKVGNNVALQQLGNVSARLNALRRGASGVALSGLAFRLDGKILPGDAFASLLPDELRGGGASADGGMARWSAFVSGVIGGGDQKQTDQEEGFKFKTKGITGGADYRFSPQFVLGLAAGYANTDLNIGGAGGGLDAKGLNMALYGTYYRSEKYYFDSVINVSHNGYEMDRVIDYTIGTTHYQKVAKGDPNSNVYALSLGGGYDVVSMNGYTVEANGRAQYVNSTISSYEETGAGAYNLAIERQDMNLVTASAGALFTKAFSFRWGVLVPQVRVTWDHEFAGDAGTIKGSFVNGPGSGFNPTFSFKTEQVDRDYFRYGVGSTLVRPGGATAFLQYETTRGKTGYSDYNVAFGGRWEF